MLLGDGIRLYDSPGGEPARLELLNGDVPTAEVNVQYRPRSSTAAENQRRSSGLHR